MLWAISVRGGVALMNWSSVPTTARPLLVSEHSQERGRGELTWNNRWSQWDSGVICLLKDVAEGRP